MKYSCPKCKSVLSIQKTFNKKILISCNSCGLEDFLEYAKNFDEVYLDFLTKFDDGKIPNEIQIKDSLMDEGILRDENEIKKMIGKSIPDPLTKSVLFSQKDYLSYFKTLIC